MLTARAARRGRRTGGGEGGGGEGGGGEGGGGDDRYMTGMAPTAVTLGGGGRRTWLFIIGVTSS